MLDDSFESRINWWAIGMFVTANASGVIMASTDSSWLALTMTLASSLIFNLLFIKAKEE